MELLDEGGGGGVLKEGVEAGRWIIEYHGPDLSVTHQDHPQQTLMLTADGFELQPPTSETARTFALPPPPRLTVCAAALSFEELVCVCVRAAALLFEELVCVCVSLSHTHLSCIQTLSFSHTRTHTHIHTQTK